jgi:hypothetical protein
VRAERWDEDLNAECPEVREKREGELKIPLYYWMLAGEKNANLNIRHHERTSTNGEPN